ncbi:MAG: anti-sigma factor antagonist [Oscillospiraceae bacterium]
MSVSFEKVENVLIANISGDIDHHSAVDIRTEIDTEVQTFSPKILKLDFQRVGFMDSSGIGLVLGRYKLMQGLGGEITVVNTPNYIKKVMILAGLDRIADIH